MSSKRYTHYEFGGPMAAGYDAFNHAASLGLDLKWRRRTARLIRDHLRRTATPRILDLACGTGDMVFAVTRALPRALALGTDPSADMLRRGQEKNATLKNKAQLIRAVMQLPFGNQRFDAVTCAFGARNFVRLQDDLLELLRLLKPDGAVYILDFFVPENIFVRTLLKAYNFFIFPFLGFLLTGRIRPYRYLYQSIFKFMSARDFAGLAERTGYKRINVRRFFFGLVHLIVAYK